MALASAGSLKANAISFASDHLENDTLVLIRSSSKIYGIRLQNPTDSEVGVKIEYDNAFMKIINYKEVYKLPPRETGYSISFNVTAPKKPGIYNVGYTVMEVESGGGGGLPIRLKINRNFKLKVIEGPNKFYIDYFSLSFIAVLLLLAFAILKKVIKKQKPSIKKLAKKD